MVELEGGRSRIVLMYIVSEYFFKKFKKQKVTVKLNRLTLKFVRET